MKLVILIFLAINIGAIYAATIESRPLNMDSKSLDETVSSLETKNTWITDTKMDDKNNITEFQAKYEDHQYGISIIYVIPFNLMKINTLKDSVGKNIKCESEYIRFVFNQKKFDENNIYVNTGKIWMNNSIYFPLNKAVSGQYEVNRHLDIDTKDFDEYLRTESNLKITFEKTKVAEKSYKDSLNNLKMIWSPLVQTYISFTGAKDQLLKAQNACIDHLHLEQMRIAEEKKLKEKEDAQVKAYKEQQFAEINRRNTEIQNRLAVQMKKPDVQIGMTKQQVVKNTRWGMPMRVNSLTTKYGITEQWTYWGYKYLYFTNGKLVAIQK